MTSLGRGVDDWGGVVDDYQGHRDGEVTVTVGVTTWAMVKWRCVGVACTVGEGIDRLEVRWRMGDEIPRLARLTRLSGKRARVII